MTEAADAASGIASAVASRIENGIENAQGQDAEVLLAAPRGFCAGVDRAIEIVERALAKFGAPIYVRHEITELSGQQVVRTGRTIAPE